MHSSKIELAADSHLSISSRSLELLKWVAVLCMLQEHFFRYVVGELPDLAHMFGRLTFPLFAFCLAAGFTQLSDERKWRVNNRLWLWAIIAQITSLAVPGRIYGNVLFIFASATLVHLCWNRDYLRITRGLSVLVACVVSVLSEFGPLGVLGVLILFLAQQFEEFDLPLTALAIVAIAFINADWVPLLALPIVLIFQLIDVGPPRIPHLFYWVYAAQFPIFGALAWLS